MEFRDLKVQYLNNKKTFDNSIEKVLLDTHFIGGEEVNILETKLKQYVGSKYCITCGNGTDALLLALMAWNIGEGDAVFVPDFTFFSSAEVIPWVGATPIFVDVDETSYNISVDRLETEISKVLRDTDLIPKVIIGVDLFGRGADFKQIRRIAEKYKMFILEDGAQGFGGSTGKQKNCSFGDISTTSFFPAKPLGCYGDGGALFTNNDEWADKIYSLKVHGKGYDKYDNVRIGMNSRLDTIQAAVLIEKMNLLDNEIEKCEGNAKIYSELLNGAIVRPQLSSEDRSAWAQYTIQVPVNKSRDKLIELLKKNEIPSAVYYRKPIHKQKAMDKYYTNSQKYPVTESLCQSCLSLPMHAYLGYSDIENVCDTINSFVANAR